MRPTPRGVRAPDPSESAPAASLGACRHGHQSAENSPFEQSVKDRAGNWLAERADVDQEGEHGEDRKRDRELHPRLQALPPDHQSWRARLLPPLRPPLFFIAPTLSLLRSAGPL